MSDDGLISFADFVELVDTLGACNGHKERSTVISRFIREGDEEAGNLHSETALVLKLLLPKSSQRTYNVQDKQLIKHFSEIFDTSKEDMLEHLEKGNISDTLFKFYKRSGKIRPLKHGKVSLKQVDKWLDDLSQASSEDTKINILLRCTKLCTADEFLIFIRLIKKDLRVNAGSKQILDSLDPNAYAAYQVSHDLEHVVAKVRDQDTLPSSSSKPKLSRKQLSISIRLMTPVLPMLAEPGRSADAAINKGTQGGGLIVEIKYDGERVQVHKKGNTFVYFSRSLKPVAANKVEHLKDFIPKAFPGATDLILDAEVLLMDTTTKKPLPFGTLGVHKRSAFKDAVVCLFVFDCLFINGKSLLLEPMHKRRELLEQNMTPIADRVLLSEKHTVRTKSDLNELMAKVFADGLEGLVLKTMDSIYEPGKRHWMKIKKDYLGEGAMADSADLIVLGAYFGTGNKGGLMSVFLMGAYDKKSDTFCTVTKCGNGFDDRTLLKLQKQLRMVKISKDFSQVPNWLNVNRSLTPDFVVEDPKKAPIWEITGAEFSRAGSHTAGTDSTGTSEGISIRFPRVTKMRPDKSWKEATDVDRLKVLLAASRSQSDWSQKLSSISDVTTSPSTSRGGAKRQASKPAISNRQTPPKKKPCLVRVTDMQFLNSLFDGFVISVSDSVTQKPEFDQLHRRLVACGATVKGNGLRPTDKSITHVIVDNNVDAQTMSSSGGAIPVTMEWLASSVKQAKLLPLCCV